MKVKMFTGKTVANSSIDAGSLLTGGMLSSGIEGAVPIDDSKMRKGVLAVVGILGAASISGNSTSAKVVRNLLIGMGVRQGQRFIQEAATPTLPEVDGTTMNKFMHDMMETGGGDQITKPTVEARRRMGMGYRFNPRNQATTMGNHYTAPNPRMQGSLEFPLT